MTNEQIIREAISRSISHDEIVHVKINGDSGDALTVIHHIVDCEVDYAMCDYEGIDTLDVWGYDEDAMPGEMLWRLAVRFA
jgi:hypothetical protein